MLHWVIYENEYGKTLNIINKLTELLKSNVAVYLIIGTIYFGVVLAAVARAVTDRLIIVIYYNKLYLDNLLVSYFIILLLCFSSSILIFVSTAVY